MATATQEKLSPTMQRAIRHAEQYGGKLTRSPGGYWSGTDLSRGIWFGTSTVEALAGRGVLTYTAWREGGARRFPIEATLTASLPQTDR